MYGQSQIAMQRSRGAASAAFAKHGMQTKLVDLHQSGSAKIMFPSHRSLSPEVVFLNSSGGFTGGDTLSMRLDLGADACVLATTQTAERAYASTGDAARVSFTATVGKGAHLDWMPQETILYQHSHLSRHTEIDLASDASCLLAETVVLGRAAMGEALVNARLHDHRMIRRAGRPVWADTMQLSPETLTWPSAALLHGARALAVVCLVAQGAQDAVAALRAAVPSAAVSGWDGKCLVRLTATDGWPLKQILSRILCMLSGRALPRVWPTGEAQ
jgi:urease accessory protein